MIYYSPFIYYFVATLSF